ncbi:MAG: CotS family spore coat protein [Bacillota bacterium]|nr:CotS family spore coat protein [Bacillota bacterium]MDD3298401.1 CotS family spore coat protein [Bacillota bacterium]MDD3850621.1 CotS family spore coat protein [Bacillota bacterium]MDD4708148.1 CotS family spore coat protein [Bacillota bacterium]
MMERQNATDLNVLAESVLMEYGITPNQSQIIQNKGLKTLWKFSHNGETMCLKRLRHSPEKADFSVNAQVHIYGNGGKVPRIIRNNKGDAVTLYEGQVFVLYGWIDGRDLNFDSPGDLALAVEGLARVHGASIGYRPPEGARVSSKLGKWPGQYQSMRTNLAEWKEASLQSGGRPERVCFLKRVDSMLELADRAIEAISNSPYERLTSMEQQRYPLCHQDYGKGNALLLGTDVYVLDLDGATYDLAARDLRKIIGKQMEDGGGWSRDRIIRIVEWYEKGRKVSAEEKEVLVIDLMFPHWFFGEVKDIYKKNKIKPASKIEKAAAFEKSKLPVLQGLFGGGRP